MEDPIISQGGWGVGAKTTHSFSRTIPDPLQEVLPSSQSTQVFLEFLREL